jgi:hypothetical protein
MMDAFLSIYNNTSTSRNYERVELSFNEILTLAPPPPMFDILMFVQLLGVIFDITLSGVGQCRLLVTDLGIDQE